MRIYVDGDAKPTIQGTGTEDYFLMAWGLNESLFPYFGCTYMSCDYENLGTEYCLYLLAHRRPHPVSRSPCGFEIEHTGWITATETTTGETAGHVEREDDIATVAFWYQVGQPKRFTTLPPLAQRRLPNLDVIIEGKTLLPTAKHSPGVLEVQKGYDWTGDGQLRFMPTDDEPILEVEFTIEKAEYRGLILRSPTPRTTASTASSSTARTSTSRPTTWRARRSRLRFLLAHAEGQGNYLGSFQFTPGKHTLRLSASAATRWPRAGPWAWTPFACASDGSSSESVAVEVVLYRRPIGRNPG